MRRPFFVFENAKPGCASAEAVICSSKIRDWARQFQNARVTG